jgi:hypothetical protein
MKTISHGLPRIQWRLGLWLACALVSPLAASPQTGSIRATIDCPEPILGAWVIARADTSIGVESRPRPARVDQGKLVADNLPVPGRYDLRFETKSGIVQGWDATLPASDYVEEQPLDVASWQTIIRKMAKMAKRGFADRVVILDIQGNIQNAAVLVTRLRTRAFTGGGYKPGEWVWRVERWQWEYPDEDTWAPFQDRPYYTLERKRIYKKQFEALQTTYCRHLGGITLTQQHPERIIDVLRVPPPKEGVCALQPDGERAEPVTIKPGAKTSSSQDRPPSNGGSP